MNIYYSIIKKKKDKSETEEARDLLKRMLDSLGLDYPEIIISEYGKPYFKDSNIYFNYSHSKNYLACVISNCEVGIDIEEINSIVSDDIANRYLDGIIDNDKRLEAWVKKESFSKLNGLGFGINLQDIILDQINKPNLLIKEEEYICSIYSDKEGTFIRL